MTWHDLLRRELDLDPLEIEPTSVPFGVPPIPGTTWEAAEPESVGRGLYRMRCGSSTGLEADTFFQFTPDTRAVEIWGSVTNRGSKRVADISRTLTVDMTLRFRRETGQPWLRTVNGARLFPTSFPPHDFAVVDRQLVDTPQAQTPTIVAPAQDGRSSVETIPVAILAAGHGSTGLAFMLEWSGTWGMSFQQNSLSSVSVDDRLVGIEVGLWGLALDLRPGQSIPLARTLVAAFDGTVEDGSNAIRRHIRRHVAPLLNGEETLPPVSYNHWFAFRDNFTAASLRPAVAAAASAGLEYLCVDGGWFPPQGPSENRANWRTGIGNWDEGDPNKFPDGIAPFAEYVRSQGMKYGSWFEPEWAHRSSDLYRAHPEWFLESPDPGPTAHLDFPLVAPGLRLVFPDVALMDFGLPEVQQWWMDRLVRAYDEWGMRWVRWDFNQKPRPNWEHGVPTGEIGWRQIGHIAGLYRVLDEVMAACPDLLVEQCASGGHRIDLGMARRGHSFWINDHTTNSDVVRAMQHGLNAVLPGNYANTNLCQPRHDFDDYDFLSHGAGAFGYSGKLWEAPKADFERYRHAVERFKSYRHLLLGDYTRSDPLPTSPQSPTSVTFADGGESITMSFNEDGPRSAQLAHEGVTALQP